MSTVNSEDIPSYMRTTTASIHRERATPSSMVDSGDELASYTPKRRSKSRQELDIDSQPSYMKPTNRLAIASRLLL